MKVQYTSNNSGGNWWLTDEDWFALEKAGWKVEWTKKKTLWENPKSKKYPGKYEWLGALAKEASKDFKSIAEAMQEFEEITGQRVSDEGCNCCGAPHTFSWGRAIDDSLPKDAEYGYASGESCLQYLFPEKGQKTLREMYEEG